MRMEYWSITASLIILATAGLTSVVEAATPQAFEQQVQVVAPNMFSEDRAQEIAAKLYAAPGVTAVDANFESRTVGITLSQQKGASLELLWKAVEAGEGGPTSLKTAEATFSLASPEALAGNSLPPQGTTIVVIDNLHCKGCARKIASQIYTIPGINEVRADMQQSTMIVKNNNGQSLSAWALIGAVANAKERPLAIIGASGRMDIAWSAPKTVSAHQTSSQPINEGVQR